MNKFKNVLMMAAFILPVLFISTSCSDDDDDDNGWSDAEIEAIKAECVSEEQGNQEQCDCFYDKVTSEFSKSQFENEDFSEEDGLTILEFAIDCDIDIFNFE
ncbi:MAG: hypothetical protein ABJH98_10395 [Reichenbachiella sp.]|uniref:hypothetical protein n=1 Tax=Reichenbachiella sp. TaxID=2184521 RepID=UPI00329A3DC8